MGADTVKDDTIMSIDKAMEDGAADDGMPVKLAEHVKPGDVVILDWPAWVLCEVMFVHHETAIGSGVHFARWQVRPLGGGDVAFVMRGAHEYVRVRRAIDNPGWRHDHTDTSSGCQSCAAVRRQADELAGGDVSNSRTVECVIEVGHPSGTPADWRSSKQPDLTVCDRHRDHFETAYDDYSDLEPWVALDG